MECTDASDDTLLQCVFGSGPCLSPFGSRDGSPSTSRTFVRNILRLTLVAQMSPNARSSSSSSSPND